MRSLILVSLALLTTTGCSFIDDFDSFHHDGGGTPMDLGPHDAGDAATMPDAGYDAGPCALPRMMCTSVCVDPMTSHQNCNSCGHPCGAAQSCQAGACVDDSVTQIVAGNAHTCVLRSSGRVSCWGNNDIGQLGDVATSGSNSPVPADVGGLPSGEVVVQVAAGANDTCARTANRHIYCWGDDYYAQLGDGVGTDLDVQNPVPVSVPVNDAAYVAIGYGTGCAIGTDPTDGTSIFCWGYNGYGGVGVDPALQPSNVSPPLRVGSAPGGVPSTLAVGQSDIFTIAIYAQNPYSWGSSTNGALGDGTFGTFVPTLLTMPNIRGDLVHAGSDFACLRTSTNALSCWGDGSGGRLGRVMSVFDSTPMEIPQLHDVEAFSTGGSSACAIAQYASFLTTNVWCWGSNNEGQLGLGTVGLGESTETPQLIDGLPAGSVFRDVAVGDGFACFLTASSEVYCVGANDFGQCGAGDVTDPMGHYVPVAVVGLGG